jgi:ABC-type sugar transport system ATPase subunit
MATLEVRGIHKRFGAVRALNNVSLFVNRGEILGLVGDNGAGKSTMIKILAGIYPPTEGEILLDDEPTAFHSPLSARAQGVETVHQTLELVEEFNVAENFYLGRELSKYGILRVNRSREMRARSAQAVSELGIKIPGGVRRSVRSMSGGQRQAVAIARAAFWHTKVLLLDEPTAALGVRESGRVVELVDRLAHEHGAAILLISHNMEQVRDLCDRVVVLRQGRKVAELNDGFDVEDVVGYITGAREEQRSA